MFQIWRRPRKIETDKELDDGLSYIFDFQFPWAPSHGTPKPMSYDFELGRFVYAPAELIPPTGEIGHGCSIEYKVEVVMVEENSGCVVKSEKTMEFYMTRTDRSPDPGLMTSKQRRRLPTKNGLFTPGTVAIDLQYATNLMQGEKLSLSARFAPDQEGTSEAQVLLRSGSVKLFEETILHGFGDSRPRRTKLRALGAHIFCGEAAVLDHRPTDLAELLCEPRIPIDQTPSFSCNSMDRSYGLKVSIALEIEGLGWQGIRF